MGDLFASGFVGNSQSPALADVLENGRLKLSGPFFVGNGLLPKEVAARALADRRDIDDIDSLSN